MTPPHHVPEDKPFVQTLLSCYEQVMGKRDTAWPSAAELMHTGWKMELPLAA